MRMGQPPNTTVVLHAAANYCATRYRNEVTLGCGTVGGGLNMPLAFWGLGMRLNMVLARVRPLENASYSPVKQLQRKV